MAHEIKIIDKKVRLDITDSSGKIGEISFNPDDTRVFTRFCELVNTLYGSVDKLEAIGLKDEEISSLKARLESVDDFGNARQTFVKLAQVGDVNAEAFDEVSKGLDSIFGEGVCEMFTEGENDPELLEPLLSAVTPYFQKSRENKKEQYKA